MKNSFILRTLLLASIASLFVLIPYFAITSSESGSNAKPVFTHNIAQLDSFPAGYVEVWDYKKMEINDSINPQGYVLLHGALVQKIIPDPMTGGYSVTRLQDWEGAKIFLARPDQVIGITNATLPRVFEVVHKKGNPVQLKPFTISKH